MEELADSCWLQDPCCLEKRRHGQEPGAERFFADPVDGEEVEVWTSRGCIGIWFGFGGLLVPRARRIGEPWHFGEHQALRGVRFKCL